MTEDDIKDHIEKWDNDQQNIKKMEKFLIGFSVGLILGGFILDVFGYYCSCEWYKQLDSISQVILQIQGTITALSLTVITLISGNIEQSVYGVSITDFYMNILPWRLKQKRVIIIMLAEMIINFILYLLWQYFMVMGIYISGIIITLYDALMMYSAFKGKREIDNLILRYVLSVFDKNGEFEKKEMMLENFEEDWLELIVNQNTVAADRYKEIYLHCCKMLIKSAQNMRGDDIEVLKDEE